jgi:PERQ amino acid-rich with GYF domain-containing protein
VIPNGRAGFGGFGRGEGGALGGGAVGRFGTIGNGALGGGAGEGRAPGALGGGFGGVGKRIGARRAESGEIGPGECRKAAMRNALMTAQMSLV